MIKFDQKLAICYTCCGPTYRKTALHKLQNVYIDHPNLYYFILTDDKSYFKDVKRDNLVINELKDFYNDFPNLEKYEWFLESLDEKDYAEKFIKLNYKFPYSTMRFHIQQVKPYDIPNIAFLSTDTTIELNTLDDTYFNEKNIVYNTQTQWMVSSNEEKMKEVVNLLYREYKFKTSEDIMVFDGAARLYVFENFAKMETFFDIWNNVIKLFFEEDRMKIFLGWYAINDEYIISCICDVLGIKRTSNPEKTNGFLITNHNSKEERFWMTH